METFPKDPLKTAVAWIMCSGYEISYGGHGERGSGGVRVWEMEGPG